MATIRRTGTRQFGYFNEREFYRHNADQPDSWEMPDEIIEALNLIREFVGVPVIINSTFRGVNYNKQVGGAENSYHLQGRAVDFKFKINNKQNLKKVADSIRRGDLMSKLSHLGVRGFGFYGNFIHIDNRPVWTIFKDKQTGLKANTTVSIESDMEEQQPKIFEQFAEKLGFKKEYLYIAIAIVVILIAILLFRRKQGLPLWAMM